MGTLIEVPRMNARCIGCVCLLCFSLLFAGQNRPAGQSEPASPASATRQITLDVVVTAVEYGHGKRVGVLSDYTFAVWDGDRLANMGKAYSGLTDAEIAEMTHWFLEHTIENEGFRRTVEPKIVLEVAFDNMMQSDRHDSGYALRFPRIVRLRPDKSAHEADTIERVREIFEKQNGGA